MAGPRPWRATGVALLALSLLAAAPAGATSLQVAPTSLQLEARQRAGELWLTNSGTSPVRLQVRVFRWVQQDGQEQLLPTEELLATPPMQELGAGQQQLVRVMRPNHEPPAAQQYYRLIVDEVPDLATRANGMQFVLRYSIPVFVQPRAASWRRACRPAWSGCRTDATAWRWPTPATAMHRSPTWRWAASSARASCTPACWAMYCPGR